MVNLRVLELVLICVEGLNVISVYICGGLIRVIFDINNLLKVSNCTMFDIVFSFVLVLPLHF